jgi:gluconate 5-dehydrogenase
MRILVAGATGGIGGAVKRAALAAGHEVAEANRESFASADGLDALEGPFDAVVFAVGVCPVKPLAATDEALLAETVTVNCAFFLRLMRRIVAGRLYRPEGMKAVAVSSVSAVEGWPGGSAYCASKGALSALCRALDAELGPRKISVKAIEPGHVKTRMFDSCAGRMGVDPALARDPGELAREILAMLEE